jgi:amino acid transporter
MVMCGLGEVASYPFTDGFAGYCNRYIDPALGFACGYVYLFQYLILPANQSSVEVSDYFVNLVSLTGLIS